MATHETVPVSPALCIHELIDRQSDLTPAAPALVQGARQLSYRQLATRSNQLAHALRGRGVGPDVPVALLPGRDLDSIVALLAILKAGGAYLPLDPAAPVPRQRFVLNDTAPPLLLVGAEVRAEAYGALPHLPMSGQGWADDAPTDRPAPLPQPHHLAYVLYTSGSTGQPKGVAIEHRSVVNHCLAWLRRLQLGPGRRVLQFAPLYFDASVAEIFPCLASGSTLILPTDSEQLPGPELWRLLSEGRVHILGMTPTALLAMPTDPLPDLDTVIVGGEVCPAELVARWAPGRTLWNAYGPTEATCDSTVMRCQDTQHSPPIGKPIEGVEIYILDPQRQPVPAGELGEIYIGGLGLARGYYNRPELTAERFVTCRIADGPPRRLYRSGDRGRFLPGGEIEFAGRIDQQVKLRGYRIELGEIEAVLATHPQVQGAAVTLHAPASGVARLIGYIVPRQLTAPPSWSELRAHLRTQLPEYMIPAAFVPLSALPRTANDKLDRSALPVPPLASSDSAEANPVGTTGSGGEIVRVLSQIFAAVLCFDSVAVSDDFFALGGDSISAIKIVSRAAQAGLFFSVRQLFEHPTIAALLPLVQTSAVPPPAATPPTAIDDGNPTLAGLSEAEKQRLLSGLAAQGLPGVLDLYPLTSLQEGLLFHTLLTPDAAVYHEQVILRLAGDLDPVAMQRALQDLLDRQPALRTGFLLRGVRKPLQIVYAHSILPFAAHDLRTSEAPEAALAAIAASRRAAGFDLLRAPPLRVDLARLGEREWALLLGAHHAILDGWSLQQMFAEVFAAYGELVAGRIPALPPGRSLRDYVEWLARSEPAEAFWRKILAGFSAPTALPLSRPLSGDEQSGKDKQAGSLALALPSGLEARLGALGRANQLTGNALFASAFAILISRLLQEDDVLFGMTVAGRPPELPDIEVRLGLFINTLPVRARPSPQSPFLHWARELAAQLLAMRAHEATPLRSCQKWSDVPPGQPLFEIGFVYQNFPVSLSDLGRSSGLTVRETGGHLLTSFPLGLMVRPGDPEPLLFEYDARRFATTAIERLGRYYVQLLSAIVEAPLTAIARLPLLTAAERHTLVVEWSHRPAEPAPEVCVHDWLAAVAARHADDIAVIDETRSLSYRELETRAETLASRLRSLGVGAEVIVGICIDSVAEIVIAILATLKAGGAYLPLDPDSPHERLAFLLADTGTRVVLTLSRLRDRIGESNAAVLCLDEFRDHSANVAAPPDHRGADGDSLCYVIYTSGSTGQPKGVAVTHRNLVHSLTARQRFYDRPIQRLLQVSSFAFDSSVGGLFGTLCSGGTLVLPPVRFRRHPEMLNALVATHGITHLLCVPSLYSFALQQPQADRDLASLTTVVVGGEVIPPDLVAAHHARLPQASLTNEYGPTEATVWCSAFRIPADFAAPVVPIGRPIDFATIYILDAYGEPVPPGVPGELHIGGATVARGYHNRPELTAEKFIADPFAAPGGKPGRLYRSGDQARFREDGCIEFVGRRDHQIKLRGYRIELSEIEATLRSHPDVQACVVTVFAEPGRERRLVAYVVPHPEAMTALPEGGKLTAERVDAWRDVYDRTLAGSPAGSPNESVQQGQANHQTQAADITFNIVGWNSSYTGTAIPAAEMREWRDCTVERLRALSPGRVWEIGCGTGLLVLPLAPHCASYLGTDFSATALASLAQAVKQSGLQHVELQQREAPAEDSLGSARPEFDLVILNSVIQYFPDAAYLRRVLLAAAHRVVDGGHIFVGDVRSLELLLAFYVSVERANGHDPAEALNIAKIRCEDEEELVVSPTFFHALCLDLDDARLSVVDVLLKHGRGDNEMNRYRYDVILRVGAAKPIAPPQPPPQQRRYVDLGGRLQAIQELVSSALASPLALHGIPNARVFADAVIAGIAEASSLEPIAPADLVTLANAHGLRLRLRPSCSDGPAYMDALWEPLATPSLPFAVPPPPAYPSAIATTAATTNDPLRAKREHLFLPQLRRYLLDRLPEYMVPADLLSLPQLPQTPSGKLDRGALPPPTRRRTAHYVPPRTPREQALADAFASVLGHKRIGIHDNFFALGGHSLQTISLVSRAEKAGIALAVRDVYSHPTVAGLAAAAGEARQHSCVIPLAAGEQPGTLVFVPAVGGHLTAHLVRLAMAVAGRQPVVGLTTPPHLGRGPDFPAMPTTLPDLGRYYAEGLIEYAKAQQTLDQPLTIIGYCFGGYAALELACALQDSGVPVSSVVMLESDPPQPSHLPKDLEGPRFDRITALLRIADLWGLPADADRLRTMTVDQVIAHLVSVMPDADIASAYEEATLRAILDTQEASHGMIDSWQIRVPAAPLHLLRADEDPDGLPPDYGWSSHAKLASLTTVPGDHHGFIRPPYLAGTATALLQILAPPLDPLLGPSRR